VYVSDPLPVATEISGLFRGHLELVANKRDFDFGISIFEQRPNGTYLQLPPYQSRASYVADLTRRRLLTPASASVWTSRASVSPATSAGPAAGSWSCSACSGARASRSTMERGRT
jgi:hypothetical protein